MNRAVAVLTVAAGAFGAGLLLRPVLAPPHAAPTVAPASHDDAAADQLWTCSMHPQVVRKEPGVCPICGMVLTPLHEAAGARAPGDALTIDPVVVQKMGVRVAPVAVGPVHATVRAVGTLEEAQPAQHDVTVRVGGYIEHLAASTEGMHVHAGDPLFDLYSPELETAVGELIGARRARAALAPDAPAGARATADALFRAAQRKLQLLGIPEADVARLAALEAPPRTVTIRSPVTGHLVQRNVVDGAAVQPGMAVLRIVDHSELWMDARVFERDFARVRVGQPAEAQVTALPGERFDGRVVFLHPHLDMTTRTATVRVVVPNPGLVLRPGMWGTVRIDGDAIPDALLVPREAVIDTGVRELVFVSLGDGHFAARTVTTGLADGEGRVQILSGLAAGEQVVTSGQFLLDAESRLREAIAKQLGDGLLVPPGGGRVPPAAAPAAGAAARPSSSPSPTDPVVRAYLDLVRILGTRPADGAPVDPAALVAALNRLVEDAPEALRPAAERARDAAVTLEGRDLPGQRKAFRDLGTAILGLVDAAPPSAAVAPRLVVVQCDMAQGTWLQGEAPLANPYYGPDMAACGTVVRTVP